MIETKQIGTLTQLTATQGYIHPLGTDTYVKQITILPTDTIDNYVEVDTPPPYTKAQYDTKVNDLIRRRYTASEEYAIHRKMLNTLLTPSPLSDTTDAETASDEYLRYNAYVEDCKEDAKNPELYT